MNCLLVIDIDHPDSGDKPMLMTVDPQSSGVGIKNCKRVLLERFQKELTLSLTYTSYEVAVLDSYYRDCPNLCSGANSLGLTKH